MISLKYIRENKDIIKETLKAKKVDFDLRKLLDNDIKWRLLVKECDDLKSLRNDVSKEIAKLKSRKINCDDKIESMKDVSSKIKNLDNQIILLLDDINNSLLYIPNTIHQSVPIGKTEDDNVLIREFGKKPSFDFEIKDHIGIANSLNFIDANFEAKQ